MRMVATQTQSSVSAEPALGLPVELDRDALIRAFRIMYLARSLDDREILLKRQNRIYFQISGAGADIDDLENGVQDGRPEGKLGHNCSGKHAGMLAACSAHGWPRHPYRDPEHPLQQRIAEIVSPGVAGIDGCGLPTIAMSLAQMAELFTTIPPRIVDAMRAHPELIGGTGVDDTEFMRALPGWIAKRGAEGLFCALSPDGVGWVFKVADGATRGLRPVLGQVLGVDAFRTVPVRNSLGEVVGSIR